MKGEIDACASADTLREHGCALKTFLTIAVGMSFGLSLDVLRAKGSQLRRLPADETLTCGLPRRDTLGPTVILGRAGPVAHSRGHLSEDEHRR